MKKSLGKTVVSKYVYHLRNLISLPALRINCSDTQGSVYFKAHLGALDQNEIFNQLLFGTTIQDRGRCGV